MIGPGDYNVVSKMTQQPRQAKNANSNKSVGFSSGNRRFIEAQELKIAAVTPGPGQYQHHSIAQKATQNKQQSKSGVFGSTERRFVQLNKQETTPGPGTYIQ